ncbi:MAG: hypothetical protein ACJAS3_002860 [Roseivirga sp.]
MFNLFFGLIKLKPIAIFVLIQILTLGCSVKTDSKSDFQINSELLTIELPGSTSANLIKPSILNVDSVEYLACYNYQDYSISVFNLTQRSYFKRIELEREGPNFISTVGSISIIAMDSILVVNNNFITLINFEGLVIDRMGINFSAQDLSNLNFSEIELVYNQYSGLQYDSSDGSILLEVRWLGRNQQKSSNKPTIAKVNFFDRKIEYLNVDISDDFLVPDGFYGDLSRLGFWRMDSSFIYNSGLSSSIYFFNEVNMERRVIPSDHINDFVAPMSRGLALSNEYRIGYEIKSEQFYTIAFDPYRNFLYRVHRGALEEENTNADFYLVIASLESETIMEIPFPADYLVYPIISQEGLMYMAYNKYDDRLEILKLKIEDDSN